MTATNHNHIPEPVPVTHDVYFDHVELGNRAADIAIATMNREGFQSEAVLYDALCIGVRPFLRGLTDADQYAVSGYLAGAANRIREALLQMSQPETPSTH